MRRSSRLALIILALFAVSGCGKKNTSDSTTTINNQGSSTPTPTTPPPVLPPVVPPSSAGAAPLSYEITKYGGSAVYTTSAITTDNILRVRFETGPAGNQFFDATDLRVEISVNGSTKVPKYTTDPACPAGGCEYGRPSDGPSTILDFTGNVSPGVPVVIQVSQARYNWYCYTQVTPGGPYGYNPALAPSCNYRLVLDPFTTSSGLSSPGHYWKGRLIVQTNLTDPAIFAGPNP